MSSTMKTDRRLPGPKAQALIARDRAVSTPSYPRDNAFYLGWDAIARERNSFLAWMERHVLSVRDHGSLLRRLGVAA